MNERMYWDGSRSMWHCQGPLDPKGRPMFRCGATASWPMPKRCPRCDTGTAELRTWDISPKSRSDKDTTWQHRRTREEVAAWRELCRWLREHREKPTRGEVRAINAAAKAAGYTEPVTSPATETDLANPYGWTVTEAEVVRLREVEGLSFREIGRRRGGISHVAVLKSYKHAKGKVDVVTPDTPWREIEEAERQDRILTLVFGHGLDGYAATIAADDPKLYTLFEPEAALAA